MSEKYLQNKIKKYIKKYSKQLFAAILPAIIGGIVIVQLDNVVDGDTIKYEGNSIRLYGIDAAEKAQVCYIKDHPWDCGKEAKKVLKNIINDQKISCIPKSKDKYGRIAAICYAGTIEINKEMVRRGYAVAYREYGGKAYIEDENYAKKHHLGIWQGTFQLPKNWRKEHKFNKKQN